MEIYTENNEINEKDLSNGSPLEQNSNKNKKKNKKKKQIPYSQEVLRKSVHLISLNIPIIYIFVSQKFALSILIPMALIAVTLDILSRKEDSWANKFIYGLFGGMLRKHELKKNKLILNGASWVLISAVLTVLVFPKVIAVISFIILIVSDIAAALVGRKWGTTKLGKKSLEGTLAFMVSGILVVAIVGIIFNANIYFYIAGVLGAVVGGFGELYAKELKLDDNLSIPVGVGITMLAIARLWNDSFLYLMN
ncbi:MAG: dolichol kinase [Candidatus Kapabacteria bacterium]|nr:dolichol kinase [Ignavibacteriota bacterium]MCW5885386.1 dolichol kinase [Candidatus Kapabacteria bacterium]